MKSVNERNLDLLYFTHLSSYLNLVVKSTDKSGKHYIYSKFDKFFDREKFKKDKEKTSSKDSLSSFLDVAKGFNKEGG
ncbi:MAG: hypothetical protein PUG22_04585 [Peptoniphilaceae bacterium]|nr:hypothetical protein [Peptoniphilaceae bacterium]